MDPCVCSRGLNQERRSKARGKDSQIQPESQGAPSLGMELARKSCQGTLGMHDFGSHQRWPQCYQCAKEEKSALEDARIHAQHEQRCCLLGPGTQPLAEDRSHKHESPNAQKHVSKPTGIYTSGQKKEKIHKARPLSTGASGPSKLSSKRI